MEREPLGIRNNNPLNIRRGKTLWKGETPSLALRRDWVVAPLCEAGATFSGSSKDLSRPL